jgi:hypothetical protein
METVEKTKNILNQDKRKNLVFYFDEDGSFHGIKKSLLC